VKTCYLAGPITECDRAEANSWREIVSGRIAKHGIRGISPLRCEPLMGDRYKISSADPRFGTPKAIASKNLFDVKNCDMTFAYLPHELNGRKPSYGTLCEMAWALALGKQVVLVTDDPSILEHPVVQACASWTVTTLEEGMDILVGVLGDYSRPE
jgi:nucleoside 2-deoxyribosyltransferase